MIVTLPVEIEAESEAMIRAWVTAGRGVRVWRNAEIGSAYPREVFTPGDAGAPNWRYTESQALDTSQIVFVDAEVLKQFRGRFKAHYYGPGVAPATERKVIKLVAAYNDPAVSWSWTPDPEHPAFVQVRITRDSRRAFSQERA